MLNAVIIRLDIITNNIPSFLPQTLRHIFVSPRYLYLNDLTKPNPNHCLKYFSISQYLIFLSPSTGQLSAAWL